MSDAACRACKFWEPPDGADPWSDPNFIGVGRCAKAVELWEATEWVDEGDDTVRRLKPGMTEQQMFVVDGSSYRADLYTKPAFYCAHFAEPSP